MDTLALGTAVVGLLTVCWLTGAFRCRVELLLAALPFLFPAAVAGTAIKDLTLELPSAADETEPPEETTPLLSLLLVLLLVRKALPRVAENKASFIFLAGSVIAALRRTARRHRRHIVLHRGSSSIPVNSNRAATSSISASLVDLLPFVLVPKSLDAALVLEGVLPASAAPDTAISTAAAASAPSLELCFDLPFNLPLEPFSLCLPVTEL